MSRQDQRVSQGGQAIQASGDVNINQGITPGQMVEIIDSLATLVQKGEDRAVALVTERLHDFKKTLVEEFAKPDSGGDAEAFREPDFQYVVNQAQVGHARRGDDTLKKELVKLLIQRSAMDTGTRKAMILNEAITTAASLTKEEYAVLAVVFLMKEVRIGGLTAAHMMSNLKDYIDPFIADLPSSNHSAEYLASMRCLSINHISANQLWSLLHKTYQAKLSSGILPGRLGAIATEDGADHTAYFGLIRNRDAPPTGSVVFTINDEDDLREQLSGRFSQSAVDKLVAEFQGSLPSIEDLKAELTANVPKLSELEGPWEKGGLNSCFLTALGKALAHAAVTSKTSFDTDLEIWVQ